MSIDPGQHHFVRRGVATADLVLLALAGSAIATTAVFVTPHVLRAEPSRSTEIIEADLSPSARAASDALSLILRQSMTTLGPDLGSGASAMAGSIETRSLILWTEDTVDPGQVNRGEVLLLEHSRMLESVTAFYFDPVDPADPSANPVLPKRVVREPEALARFITDDPHVRMQVIAVDVSEFRIEREGMTHGGSGRTMTPGEAWIVIRCPGKSDDTNAAVRVPTPLPMSATAADSPGG